MQFDQISPSVFQVTVPKVNQKGWKFGTAFVIHRDSDRGAYLLTCAHVVSNADKSYLSPMINGREATIVALDADPALDLAVLYMPDLPEAAIALHLNPDARPDIPIIIVGVSKTEARQASQELYSIEQLDGLLGNKREPQTRNRERVLGWHLRMAPHLLAQLKSGFSGAPVIDQRTGIVFGIATHGVIADGKNEGYAVSINVLKKIWPNCPPQISQSWYLPEYTINEPVTGPVEIENREKRIRSVLLRKLRTYWVDGLLANSLREVTRIELGLVYQNEAVNRPWMLTLTNPPDSDQVIPRDTPILEIIHRLDNSMLILGEPGAGKTTMLLEIAKVLLNQADRLPSFPIPLLLNLSSWSTTRYKFSDWLVSELQTTYQVNREYAQNWLSREPFWLLLDGLDEVNILYRDECVESINSFRKEYGLTNVIVCSRLKDYEKLSTKLNLTGAIKIQALSPEDIDIYLSQADNSLRIIREALRTNTFLREFIQTPLSLSIVSLAFKDATQDVFSEESIDKLRDQVFATYIQKMLNHRSNISNIDEALLITKLRFLAYQLTQHSQTIYLIENMQPDWLSGREREKYNIWTKLLFTLIGGVPSGLVMGFVFSLFFNPMIGIWAGLLSGIIFGFGMGFDIKIWEIRLVESLGWSWRNAQKSIARGIITSALPAIMALLGILLISNFSNWNQLIGGLIGGGLGGMLFGASIGGLFGGELKLRVGMGGSIVFGLLLGLGIGLATVSSSGFWGGLSIALTSGFGLGLFGGLISKDIEEKSAPNQGIRNSIQSAVRGGLVGGLVGGLTIGMIGGLGNDLNDGLLSSLFGFLFGGVIGFLVFGGEAIFKHLMLRRYLRANLPWRIVDFLNAAINYIFLRQVGGGYVFIHRMLLEYFAENYQSLESHPPKIGNMQ